MLRRCFLAFIYAVGCGALEYFRKSINIDDDARLSDELVRIVCYPPPNVLVADGAAGDFVAARLEALNGQRSIIGLYSIILGCVVHT